MMPDHSPELEQRLKKLEMEQTTQETVLEKLSDFGEEVRKLEAILAKIDNYEVKQHQEMDFNELRDFKETEKLERKLARIDEENEYVTETQMSDDKTTQEKQTIASSTDAAPHSYVICLMFDPKLPQEWSGNGWCQKGKGMRYGNPAQVKQIFRKLKKQWPDHPLKIFKR
jgi:uncharacterized coiled-coil protein SlyX